MSSDRDARESLIANIAAALSDSEHIAVGSIAPVHAAGALLAAAREPAGFKRVTILGSRSSNFFMDGGQELFDAAAQGRIDAFILGGNQIDGFANINFVGRGSYPNLTVRWPGSFGSPLLYSVVRKIVLVAKEHSLRSLPQRVDFISAAGPTLFPSERRGQNIRLVSELCAFEFGDGGFALSGLNAGVSEEDVRSRTGFSIKPGGGCDGPLEGLTGSDRLQLSTVVADGLEEVYPGFALYLREYYGGTY